MLKSKLAFSNMSKAYEEARRANPPTTEAPFEVFADVYLSNLLNANYAEYSNVMSLVDFFEYIGMLEQS